MQVDEKENYFMQGVGEEGCFMQVDEEEECFMKGGVEGESVSWKAFGSKRKGWKSA